IFDALDARPEADRSSEMPIAGLLPAHRTMSTYSQAYGGDLAALYARGELAPASERDSILAVLRDENFGSSPQPITRPFGPAMSGGSDGDFIVGTVASETIAGGPGDDLLFGGERDDTYVF